MNESSPSSRSLPHLLSGVLGGLIVLIAGAALIATDVIDTGDETRQVVSQGTTVRPAAENGDGRTVGEIYEQEGRGVVSIQARGVSAESDSPFGFPQEREGTATGSGFVVDSDGTVVTNAHVVDGADAVTVRFGEDQDVDAEVLGVDASSDLAVLKVNPDDAELHPIDLGDSSAAKVGDPVVAIGNPFGFLNRTVTTGIVSAVQRQIEAPNGFTIPNAIQTDASINPGNSGGPLINAEGQVIGINSQIATGGGSGGSVGIGFAVPSNEVKRLLPKLKQGEEIKRPFIGIAMTPLTERIAEQLKLPVKEGVLITDVTDGTAASRAGLRAGEPNTEGLPEGGDVITAVDGEKVTETGDVAAAVASKEVGDEVELEVYRGDRKRTVTVKLGERPASVELGSQGQGGGGGGILP
ncbi:MAG TPA: trypsin-like peptidase domain-containing protein [Thermoleophilaceae bacterium]|nr:trypsin-like peptidase domain-containing protein [Thermoleophilaceae bacterium]